MKDRIKDLVKYKTGGKQKLFASMMGWSPAYLGKLLAGNNIGLQPVLTILRAMPEVNARWLLLGEGSMIGERTSIAHSRFVSHLKAVLDLEPFVAVMTDDELAAYNEMITTETPSQFDDDTRLRWIADKAERQMQLDHRVRQAMEDSYADKG